ncbi:hypothetical protein GGR92_005271 [Spirosoma lacussanchae]|uniref:3'-5' exoribonuclease domain-containing protein n=1 Tax=Spirosoma lacussanchae TaxID=1884249 RepID=UPI00110983ED|nr:3'-5' exoribonuclease [Spirosoma lacussanchae]
MKIFLDTEFYAGFRKPLFGKSRHFIDLISIGLVDDTGRTYYAISKEFDLDKAWADDWVRENVLKPLHVEMCQGQSTYAKTHHYSLFGDFTKKCMRTLLNWTGKTNKQIADEIRNFVYWPAVAAGDGLSRADEDIDWWLKANSVEFYAYYADYDWVLFCSLFGNMSELPTGFPMYCRDLKQMMDERGLTKEWKQKVCPDPEGEHNALVDARWNRQLHAWIEKQPLYTHQDIIDFVGYFRKNQDQVKESMSDNYLIRGWASNTRRTVC